MKACAIVHLEGSALDVSVTLAIYERKTISMSMNRVCHGST